MRLFYAELLKNNPASVWHFHNPEIPILCATQSSIAFTECYTILQILTKMPDNDLEDVQS